MSEPPTEDDKVDTVSLSQLKIVQDRMLAIRNPSSKTEEADAAMDTILEAPEQALWRNTREVVRSITDASACATVERHPQSGELESCSRAALAILKSNGISIVPPESAGGDL